MDHFNLKQAFALTPAGTMGMPDKAVNQGMFDKPGLMNMIHEMEEHSMQQGKHDPEHIDHTMPGINHPKKQNMSTSHGTSETVKTSHSEMDITRHGQVLMTEQTER